MWLLYELLLVIGLLFYLPKALWRRRLPHTGWSMRLGRYPPGVREALRGRSPLWLHAVSVGEVQAAQPLLQALAQAVPAQPLVLSTITPSGFAVASKRLGDRVVAIFFPLDLRACVARALSTIHPRALILIEAELWPTMIRVATSRDIPVVVVNGRISPRAFRRYQWVKPWLAGMLHQVDLFLMQSETDARRIVQLGAPSAKVQVTGSLKWDASLAERPSPDAIRETAARIGLNGRETVIVAGSTHRGEETVLLEGLRSLRARHPDARLIVAPRHLERLAEVEGLARDAGFTSARLSSVASGARWDVGIVDTFGQLSRYYGLAAVAFIGGSLIPHGGQNPLEAAGLAKPVVFGPFMQNFEEIARRLTAHQAAVQLTSAAEWPEVLQEQVEHPADAQAMGRRAQALTEQSQGAVQRTLDALRSLPVISASTGST